jgi:hypothetical protein
MRDLLVGTLMISSGIWFSLGFAYADFGMLKVSIVLALLNILFVVCEAVYKRSKRKPKAEVLLQAVRHGDEFFIKNVVTGSLRPSSREEVSDLWCKGQIEFK